MRTSPTAVLQRREIAPCLPSAGAPRPGHRLPRCPRPGCGGRLFTVALDLQETATVCMLCARTAEERAS
jgi:hypothetical protein